MDISTRGSKPLHRGRFGALIGVFALGLGACAKDAPQDFLNHPVGKVAKEADRLWDITFLIAVVVFFLVEGVLVYALIRFRQKPGREAAQFHGNTKLEVALTLIPSLILAALAVPTIGTIFSLAEEPTNGLNVTVVGHQFWWEYQYPDLGIVTANELHIPTGQPIRLRLEGDVINQDVIHSFWVPRLGGTQDVVPGRVNYMTLETDTPGVFEGQCKEFCGLSHALMRLKVIAQTPDEFAAWVQEQSAPAEVPTDRLARAGADLFLNGAEDGQFTNGPSCAACHAVGGTEAGGTVGPDLTHLASRSTFAAAILDLNEDNLADWLRDPSALKPGARMPTLGLSEDQINSLVAYLLTLK